MSEKLFIVDPASKKLTGVRSVTLADLGVKERADLEAWVLDHPEVLGEELLVISSEFDRFDRSNRRLDVLALDRTGKLVVVELKLDLSNSVADQQAIRYAAFCSTMTMDDVVDTLAGFARLARAEAIERILQFLEVEELPELDDRPRIILAAGSLDDQELTSTVLWLRSFGIDISCVEMTPFRLPGDKTLILVPRTIIPLAEAKDYVVRVEKKEATAARRATAARPYQALWRAVADQFQVLKPRFLVRTVPAASWMVVPVGKTGVHYEWLSYVRQPRSLRVALHFEDSDRDLNIARVNAVAAKTEEVSAGVEYDFRAGPWAAKSAAAEFLIPYSGDMPPLGIAPEAARVMKLLLDRTWPIVEAMLRQTGIRDVS